jgi:hypothetical protein
VHLIYLLFPTIPSHRSPSKALLISTCNFSLRIQPTKYCNAC